MASDHSALTWAGLSRRRRMTRRLAPSTLATRVRSLASSWAVVRRPVGETPASASPRRLDLRVKTRSNSARRASATSPAGGRAPWSTPPRARKVRCCSAMSGSLHQAGEPLEQGMGVVGAGGGLGVVLDREGGHLQALQALDDAVVGVGVGHPDIGREAVAVDREAVVVAGDRDPAGGQLDHRLVDPPVAELEPDGAAPDGLAEQLVAEADAEHRHLAEQLPGGPD